MEVPIYMLILILVAVTKGSIGRVTSAGDAIRVSLNEATANAEGRRSRIVEGTRETLTHTQKEIMVVVVMLIFRRSATFI